ncbi:hypothetical protein [Butyrivibrio sp. FCS006]|uniref:hypothetical protein n=1 Tax=Butyrivibrio sp. FCS006 TaxID=1280684 RepID=UPI000414B6CD|nr:hypothetical protein [Butyrivibrio sp. FCS006]
MWEIFDDSGKTLAIVIKHDYDKPGITFCTPDDFSQQLAYMHHPVGHVILPHVHNEVKREVLFTKEVLVLKKGRLRCDFYTDAHEYIKSIELVGGDVILLASGGHGFVCLEETEMYEIKQGPYAGEMDKTRFEAVSDDSLRIVDEGSANE